MNSILDPFVLAIPEYNTEEIKCIDYADSLECWSVSINDNLHKILSSYHLLDALVETNQYPLECNLRKVRGLNAVLSSFDAFRSCERQLTNPPFVEDYIPAVDELSENELAELIILPEHVERRLHKDVALALRKTMAKIAIAADVHKSEFAQNLMFGTKDLNEESQHIQINKSVIKWKFVTHPDQLDDIEPWENLWMHTQRAIARTYRQHVNEHVIDPDIHPCPKPYVGENFNEVILENGYYRNEALISDVFRNLVLALTNLGGYERNGRKHHELRVDDEPSNPPIIRQKDGAVAWRVWITTGRPAYRLHYWRLEDGQIELSKVGVHEDYTIV